MNETKHSTLPVSRPEVNVAMRPITVRSPVHTTMPRAVPGKTQVRNYGPRWGLFLTKKKTCVCKSVLPVLSYRPYQSKAIKMIILIRGIWSYPQHSWWRRMQCYGSPVGYHGYSQVTWSGVQIHQSGMSCLPEESDTKIIYSIVMCKRKTEKNISSVRLL